MEFYHQVKLQRNPASRITSYAGERFAWHCIRGIKPLTANKNIGGGVAANRAIRAAMEKLAADRGMTFAAPSLSLCTDNGAMIAWAGIENYKIGNITTEPFAPLPRCPLADGEGTNQNDLQK